VKIGGTSCQSSIVSSRWLKNIVGEGEENASGVNFLNGLAALIIGLMTNEDHTTLV
jgi:hypothetical protein